MAESNNNTSLTFVENEETVQDNSPKIHKAYGSISGFSLAQSENSKERTASDNQVKGSITQKTSISGKPSNSPYTETITTIELTNSEAGVTSSDFNLNRPYGIFNTFYQDNRLESPYKKEMLYANGIIEGTVIKSIYYKISENSGQSLKNVRIHMRNIIEDSWNINSPLTSYDELTLVYYGEEIFTNDASIMPIGTWVKFELNNPFTYTGGDLVIDFSREDSSYKTKGGCYSWEYGSTIRSKGYYKDGNAGFPEDLQGAAVENQYLPKIKLDRVIYSQGAVEVEVSGLTYDELTYNHVSLSWSLPAEPISSIRVYRNGSLISELSETANSFSDLNLSPKTVYDYEIKTVVGIDESDGNAISITTLEMMTIITDGLVGYWNSKQGVDGAVWKNIAPNQENQYDATLFGTSVLENGMYFDGVNDYVEIPLPTPLRDSVSATFESRLDLSSRNGHEIFANGSSENYPYLSYIYTDILLSSGMFETVWADETHRTTGVPNGEFWYTVVADKEANQIRYYIDGVFKGSKNTSIGRFCPDDFFRLGSHNVDFMPNGFIDNVRMYDRALTEDEINRNLSVGHEIGIESKPSENISHESYGSNSGYSYSNAEPSTIRTASDIDAYATTSCTSTSSAKPYSLQIGYLSLNGVSDYLNTSIMTFDRIVFDIVIDQQFYDDRDVINRYIFDNRGMPAGKEDKLGTVYNGTYLGGALYAGLKENGEQINPNVRDNITYNSRNILEIETNYSQSYMPTNSIVGAKYDLSDGYTKMDIYDIKYYDGATLVAHYDMSTGTVEDQSGNGNHATLSGGTWVGEAPQSESTSHLAYATGNASSIANSEPVNARTASDFIGYGYLNLASTSRGSSEVERTATEHEGYSVGTINAVGNAEPFVIRTANDYSSHADAFMATSTNSEPHVERTASDIESYGRSETHSVVIAQGALERTANDHSVYGYSLVKAVGSGKPFSENTASHNMAYGAVTGKAQSEASPEAIRTAADFIGFGQVQDSVASLGTPSVQRTSSSHNGFGASANEAYSEAAPAVSRTALDHDGYASIQSKSTVSSKPYSENTARHNLAYGAIDSHVQSEAIPAKIRTASDLISFGEGNVISSAVSSPITSRTATDHDTYSSAGGKVTASAKPYSENTALNNMVYGRLNGSSSSLSEPEKIRTATDYLAMGAVYLTSASSSQPSVTHTAKSHTVFGGGAAQSESISEPSVLRTAQDHEPSVHIDAFSNVTAKGYAVRTATDGILNGVLVIATSATARPETNRTAKDVMPKGRLESRTITVASVSMGRNPKANIMIHVSTLGQPILTKNILTPIGFQRMLLADGLVNIPIYPLHQVDYTALRTFVNGEVACYDLIEPSDDTPIRIKTPRGTKGIKTLTI